MNGVHVHLLINHIPILGSLFALFILISGLIWKSDHLKHAAFVMIIISALFSIGAYLSGEEAEHAVEDMIGINHEALEEHEESAEIAMWLLIITGALSLGTISAFVKKGRYTHVLVWVCLVFLLISTLSMIHTGKEGGLIRHSEILRTDT